MAVDVRPLKVNDNSAILDAIRADASMEYQRRIPAATEAGVTETVKELMNFRAHYNEFIDALVNRIGLVIARNTNWTNPLAPFKRGLLTFGDTIEEVQVGLLKAHVYDPDREYMEKDIFGTEVPEVQSNFHRVNRQNFYKITVNENLLRRAFLEPGGLSTFVNQLMSAPSTSDQWDEFLLTCSLFAKYESNGGFHHVNVPDVRAIESGAVDAKVALRKMRAMADNLTFLSTRYNAAHMPTFADRDELCLFVTPEFNAAVDVEALAGAFNVDKATMHGKIIPIPADQFGIDGAQAIMTVKDFFVIADQSLETTSQFNPVSRQNNYFLHHWQIVSASRFVPAVMFWTGADDEIITINKPVVSVATPTIEAIDGTVPSTAERGQMVALVAKAVTDPEGGQEAVMWSVTGAESGRTYITPYGVLHVAGDETATSLTVRATSTGIDAENPRADAKTATLTVNLSGDILDGWPANGKVTGIEIAGEPVDGFNAATTTYALALPAGTTVSKSKVYVTSDGPVNSTVEVASVAGGYTVTVTVDPGAGDPVVYTVNVTVG